MIFQKIELELINSCNWNHNSVKLTWSFMVWDCGTRNCAICRPWDCYPNYQVILKQQKKIHFNPIYSQMFHCQILNCHLGSPIIGYMLIGEKIILVFAYCQKINEVILSQSIFYIAKITKQLSRNNQFCSFSMTKIYHLCDGGWNFKFDGHHHSWDVTCQIWTWYLMGYPCFEKRAWLSWPWFTIQTHISLKLTLSQGVPIHIEAFGYNGIFTPN